MRLPTDQEAVTIIGKRGSGKSHEGLWQLSQRSFDEMPWIVLTFKSDDLMDAIPVNAMLQPGDAPPTDPGLYAMRCTWEDAEPRGNVDKFLGRCLLNGNTGLFIDEGQLMGQHSRGLRLVLTQGRSPRVPMIFLTQRPVHVDTFALSEPNFFQFFLLTHADDIDRVHRQCPVKPDFDELREHGPYHSFWYDSVTNRVELVGPAPSRADIFDRILYRLPRFEESAAAVNLPRRVRV